MINRRKYYFFLVFFFVGNFLYSEQSKVRFKLKKPPGYHGKILKENISIEIRDNIGSELLSLSKRIKYWPFPEPENIVEVKYDFTSFLSSAVGKSYLIISYKEEKNKWEPIKIKLHYSWFEEEFREEGRAIEKKGDVEAYWGSNVKCSSPYNQYNLQANIFKEGGYYKFNIDLEEKYTKISGLLRDSKDSKPIIDALVRIDSGTNKKLMGDNYSELEGHGGTRTNSDGYFEFNLRYTEPPVNSLTIFYIIVIKEDYEPSIETETLENLGDEIFFGNIYLDLWDKESKEQCISDKLIWNSNCKRCVCKQDIDLRYYKNQDICSIADCEDGMVIQWDDSTNNYICVSQFGDSGNPIGGSTREEESLAPNSIISPLDYFFSWDTWFNSDVELVPLGDSCSVNFNDLYQDIRSCNYENSKEKALKIYSDCSEILNDKHKAQLLANILYWNIIYPDNQTSESLIKEMLRAKLHFKDTYYGKTLAAFNYYEELPDPDNHNTESYINSEKAEIEYQEAMLHIRLVDAMIKERLLFYEYNKEIKYPVGYSQGRFDYISGLTRDVDISMLVRTTIGKIEEYEVAAKEAADQEEYKPKSLENYLEYFNMIENERDFK